MRFRPTQKSLKKDAPLAGRGSARSLLDWRAVAVSLLFGSIAGGLADITVHTLGGGRLSLDGPDYGFVDGNTMQVSQFHTPFGVTVDGQGVIFVADRDNGAIRKLDVPKNRSSTIVSGLNQPVAVAAV